jgi:hypothetical protein
MIHEPELIGDGWQPDGPAAQHHSATPVLEPPDRPENTSGRDFDAAFTPPPRNARGEKIEAAEPSVTIGQIDVVVVSDAPTRRAPNAPATNQGVASRRYWRRL